MPNVLQLEHTAPGGILLRGLRGLLQLFVDHCTKPLKTSVFKSPAIDEYARRPTHFSPAAVPYVLVDDGLQTRVFAVSFKLYQVELELGCDLRDFLLVQFVVIFEQLILKRPELSLPVGGHGGDGGRHGEFVAAQGKMLKYDLNFFRVLLEHLPE